MDEIIYRQVSEALHYCRARVPTALQVPPVGIICGSGLNGLADTMLPEPRYEIPYADIPHFPLSTGNRKQPNRCHSVTYTNRTQCQDTPANFFLACSSLKAGQWS